MKKERVLLILQAAVCIALALLLAAGAVGLYAEGAARRAENPLENIYTAEAAAEALGRAAPLVFLFLALLVAELALGVRDRNAEKPAKAEDPVKNGDAPKHRGLMRAMLFALAAAFIVLGILNGSAYDVLVKAIHICTECIGLG